MLVVQHHVCGVVEPRVHEFHFLFAELVHLEDAIVNVRHAVDVVLKDVDAEWVAEDCEAQRGRGEHTCKILFQLEQF